MGSSVTIGPVAGHSFSTHVDVLVVGAGACGMTAALAAADEGASVVIVERTGTPGGTSAMSSGLIPGAGSRLQRGHGIEDSGEIYASDILRKTRMRTDPQMALRLAEESGRTIDWLIDTHAIPLTLVPSARLPGHSRLRLHGTPNRSGAELVSALESAVRRVDVPILTHACADRLLVAADGHVAGVDCIRPGGVRESVGAGAVILASCGFAASPALVRQHIPEISEAIAHTHPGARGDALQWGEALGAATADLSGYQGHGSLTDRGLLVHWIIMSQGAFQVNAHGERFADESQGYSEQAARVLQQPGRNAWTIFDQTGNDVLLEYEEYRDVLASGAVHHADSPEALAAALNLPASTFAATVTAIDRMRQGELADRFGRDFTTVRRLERPLFGVKVTGALFHTQGGLVVDVDGRVLRPNGTPFPNLFAGGGAARGVSGPDASGYLAGNGLLVATSLGRAAGRAAARFATSRPPAA